MFVFDRNAIVLQLIGTAVLIEGLRKESGFLGNVYSSL